MVPHTEVVFPLQAPQPTNTSVKQGVSGGWTQRQQAQFVLRFVLRSTMRGAGQLPEATFGFPGCSPPATRQRL